jgi:1,2-dihydroxy-3-keto-5-methylthiopentene dioxygenase
MSQLTVYAEADGDNPILATEDIDVIKSELGAAGIHIERWQADRELANDADNDTIIAVYQAEIDRLVAERGYQTYDVVSMNPDHPEKDDFRQHHSREWQGLFDSVRERRPDLGTGRYEALVRHGPESDLHGHSAL